MKLVCIPAYNEGSTIENVIRESLSFVDKVVVCDDGSTDNTAEIAKNSGATVLFHKHNLGYGSAIITLFDYARKESPDVMITIDADGQHDPKQIPFLISTLKDNDVDVVIGSRFKDNKTSPPKYRKAGIKIITATTNIGTRFKTTDSQSGFRAYSKRAVDVIRPTETGMSVSTEILLKTSSNNLSVAEVPIAVSYDSDTSEHHPVSHGVVVLANTLKFVSIRHPLLFYGLPGLVLVIMGIALGGIFLKAYLDGGNVFFGSLFASMVLFLLGSILAAVSVILFSITNLVKDQR